MFWFNPKGLTSYIQRDGFVRLNSSQLKVHEKYKTQYFTGGYFIFNNSNDYA